MVALKPKHPWWQIRRRVLVPVVLLLLIAAFLGGWTMWMPGKSYRGALAPLTVPQQALAEALAHDVKRLSQDIGERNAMRHKALIAAADHIRESFKTAGYRIDQQDYQVAGLTFSNLTVQITGTKAPNEIVVIGAHYDSIDGSPGANDNATGVAALLALARSFAGKNCDRTLRFAAFVNEEPPCFQTQDMGSLVYARRCKQRNENIVAMISFDGLGYYNDEPNSQSYPFPFSLFYPSQGNFIAFVGNMSSRSLVHRAIGTFRRRTRFPREGAAMERSRACKVATNVADRRRGRRGGDRRSHESTGGRAPTRHARRGIAG